MMRSTGMAKEFRQFLAGLGMQEDLWFSGVPPGGYDSDDIVTLIALPYQFAAKKLGITVNVCVQTSADQDHYVVTYAGKLVLEDADFYLSDLDWSDNEFEAWLQRIFKEWPEKLALVKLLFT